MESPMVAQPWPQRPQPPVGPEYRLALVDVKSMGRGSGPSVIFVPHNFLPDQPQHTQQPHDTHHPQLRPAPPPLNIVSGAPQPPAPAQPATPSGQPGPATHGQRPPPLAIRIKPTPAGPPVSGSMLPPQPFTPSPESYTPAPMPYSPYAPPPPPMQAPVSYTHSRPLAPPQQQHILQQPPMMAGPMPQVRLLHSVQSQPALQTGTFVPAHGHLVRTVSAPNGAYHPHLFQSPPIPISAASPSLGQPPSFNGNLAAVTHALATTVHLSSPLVAPHSHPQLGPHPSMPPTPMPTPFRVTPCQTPTATPSLVTHQAFFGEDFEVRKRPCSSLSEADLLNFESTCTSMRTLSESIGAESLAAQLQDQLDLLLQQHPELMGASDGSGLDDALSGLHGIGLDDPLTDLQGVKLEDMLGPDMERPRKRSKSVMGSLADVLEADANDEGSVPSPQSSNGPESPLSDQNKHQLQRTDSKEECTPEQKQRHNDLERQRRTDLRQAFEGLRDAIPATEPPQDPSKQTKGTPIVSKIMILKEAKAKIDELKRQQADLKKAKDRAMKEGIRLRERWERLQRMQQQLAGRQ